MDTDLFTVQVSIAGPNLFTEQVLKSEDKHG
jgi:hypothetical protein